MQSEFCHYYDYYHYYICIEMKHTAVNYTDSELAAPIRHRRHFAPGILVITWQQIKL